MNDKEKKPGNPWMKSLLIWAGVLFAWFLSRAVLFPRHGLTAKQIGVTEVVNSVLLLTCIALI